MLIPHCISTKYPLNANDDFMLNAMINGIQQKLLLMPKIVVYNYNDFSVDIYLEIENNGKRYVFNDSIKTLKQKSCDMIVLPMPLSLVKTGELVFFNATSIDAGEVQIDLIGYSQQNLTEAYSGAFKPIY